MGMNPDDFWYQQPAHGYEQDTPAWWQLRARWALMPNAYRLNRVLYLLGAISMVVLLVEVTAGDDGTDLDVASQVAAVPTSSTTSTTRVGRTTTTRPPSATSSSIVGSSPTTRRPATGGGGGTGVTPSGTAAPTATDPPSGTSDSTPPATDPPAPTTPPTNAPTTAPPQTQPPGPTTTRPPITMPDYTFPTIPDFPFPNRR